MAEWGNPPAGHAAGTALGQSEPGELKHLSTRRRRKQERDHPSSGERNGASPNRGLSDLGVVGPTGRSGEATRSPLERGAADGDSPVAEGDAPDPVEVLSSARYEEPGAKPGGPPPKAEDSRVTDSGRVP